MRQVPKQLISFRFIFPFFFVIAIDAMCHGITTPVLAPLMLKASGTAFGLPLNTHIRHLMYGVIQMSATFCYMLAAPILGYVSDRFGRRRTIIYCLTGSLVGLLGYALSFQWNNLALLLLARVIVGFSTASLAIAQSAIADVSVGKEKAKNIGLIAMAMTIGLVAGPLLGGILSDTTVFHQFTNATPFYVAVALSLVNLVCLIQMTKKHKDNLPKHTFTFAACINELLKSAPLRLLLMTFLCFELAWSLYFQSLAILLVQNFQLDNKFIGLFCAYVGLVLSLSLFYGVKLVIHYFELANVILPCFVMGMIALLFGFYFNGLWVQMIIAIPVALMVGLCYATLVTLASDYAGKNKQGILMGATDSLLALAFTITAFLGGILTVTNALLPELVAAGFLLLAGICFWRFRGVA